MVSKLIQSGCYNSNKKLEEISMTEKAGLLRKDALPESTWAGSEVFPTWIDWEDEYKAVEAEFSRLTKI